MVLEPVHGFLGGVMEVLALLSICEEVVTLSMWTDLNKCTIRMQRRNSLSGTGSTYAHKSESDMESVVNLHQWL